MLKSHLPALLMILTTCSPQPDPSPSEMLDLIRIGVRREPDSFNPFLSTLPIGETIAKRLFPTLFREEPELMKDVPRLAPVLVERFAWSVDRLALTLTLKEGLTWSDGSSLTTADVAFSLEARDDPEVAWIGADPDSAITGWQITDEREIRIFFKRDSPFNLLDLNEGWILPSDYFGHWPFSEWHARDWSKGLVTFGPYSLESYNPGEGLILKPRDPNDGPRLGFAVVRQKETLYQLLLNGDLDYAWSLPVERIPQIVEKLEPAIYPNGTLGFISWNPIDPGSLPDQPLASRLELERFLNENPHPLFSDARVRAAMTHAMHRDHYNNLFWDGKSRVPESPWDAGPTNTRTERTAPGQDLDKADRLLTETGWVLENGVRQKGGKSFTFSIICNAGSGIRELYLQAIQQDLKRLGIEMRIEIQEVGRYQTHAQNRKFDAFFGVVRVGTRPDLSLLYHGDSALDGGFNFSSWTRGDPWLDRLKDATTPEQIREAVTVLNQRFDEDQPATLLYVGLTVGASGNARLKSQANYLDPLYQVEKWSQPKKP